MAITPKKRKIKTKKISIRLSYRQILIIERYCTYHELTRNKFMKQALKEFLLNNYDLDDDNFISKNQLKLFDFEDDSFDVDDTHEKKNEDDKKQMNLF